MRRMIVNALLIAACLLLVAGIGESQERNRRGGRNAQDGTDRPRMKGRQQGPPFTFYTEVPAHDFDIILGRPTRDSITISVLAYRAIECYVVYGTSAEELNEKIESFKCVKGQPKEIVLSGLKPDSQQYYRLCWRRSGADAFTQDNVHSFHTQRSPGTPFTFTVQADSHLDVPEAPTLYTGALLSAFGNVPDFHIDLGDTFMTDKRRQDYTASLPQYVAQRYYFGLLCHSAPLFLVLGNHDGESGQSFSGQGDSIATWSNTMRKRYFPNPVPNEFYTGNAKPFGSLGLPEDYYAWEWGDALFVVLDPYWFTTSRARESSSGWERTLGEEQYRWLANTLEHSTALFKFVFIHNLVGGTESSMRGGAEAARYFEWGGHDPDGRYAFDEKRPGWSAPIHELLKRYGVNVVFHGHDHFFAHQELDGVTYQLVPQPSHPEERDVTRMAAEYGYVTGDFLPSPGYLKVEVGKTTATVSYVKVRPTNKDNANTSETVFKYQIDARTQGNPSDSRKAEHAGEKS